MRPSTNPFSSTPTKLQLEQEHNLNVVRDNIMSVLEHYKTTAEEDEEDDGNDNKHNELDNANGGQSNGAAPLHNRRPKSLGPLNLQGCINHRLSIADVLSKSYDCGSGSWGNISKALRRVPDQQTMRGGNCRANEEYVSYNTSASIPPDLHAAVALNAMMEKYTSGFHHSSF